MPWTCTYCGKTFNIAQWAHNCPNKPAIGKSGADLPPELQAALDADIETRMMYGRLTPTQKRKLTASITEGDPKTRKKRTAAAVKALRDGKL